LEATGEAWTGSIPLGNARSNMTADHVEVLGSALA
jgi:hypothetical protein